MDKALRYVLEIYRQIRQSGSSRIDASKTVAKKNRISQQTVMSACTRDVGIRNTAQFDVLIEPKNISEFRSVLVKRYPASQEEIDHFFMAFGIKGESTDQVTSKIETLFDDERRSLRNELMIREIRKRFAEWQARSDIPPDVRKQISQWRSLLE
jgi:hypothetical protein